LNNDIFWGDVYVESDGQLSWCRSNERVPLKMVPTSDGKPHIGAMTLAGDKENMYLLSYNDFDVRVGTVFCFYDHPPV
jgi:hypothetical protein